MRLSSPRLFDSLANYRRYATSLRWLMLTLGTLIVALHLHDMSVTLESLSWQSDEWWHYWIEALLLLGILVLVALSLRSERVRSELEVELERRGARFQDLAEYVGDVFWFTDRETGNIMYVSPGYESIWGRKAEELYRHPEQWFECIDPDYQIRLASLRRNGRLEPYEVEYPILRPDGTRRWVRDRGYPIRNELGEVVRFAGIATDITERRELAEELTRRDRLLNLASRMARLGGWTLDINRKRLSLNEEARRLLELPARFELSRHQFKAYCTAESWRSVQNAILHCLRSKNPVDVETQMTTSLGRYLWVRIQAHPVLDSAGRVVSLEGAIQDLSDRKHASLLLAQGAQRFRSFANAIPHMVWTSDLDGRLDFANSALVAYLADGDGQASLNDWWCAAIHPNDRAAYGKAWSRAVSSGDRFEREVRLQRFDNEWQWHSVQALPVRDARGEIVKWCGSAINVHERRIAENQARQMADRVTTILESITDAFFTLDPEWRFSYVNREAERLMQRKREEMLGRSIWELFPDAVGSEVERHYLRAVETQGKVAFDTYYDPLGIWVSVNVYPSPEGLSVYFKDITEQHKAEAKREQIKELERSRELAEAASQTKSRFLASMSHEIRTPINGIAGMAEVLQKSGLENEQLEMVDIIKESSHSLLEIVNDILDFSKIEAGKMELSPVCFSPSELVRRSCVLLDQMALNLGVELTLFTDPGLPDQVYGDEQRLRQVILNLGSNAIKFSSRLDRRGVVSVRLIEVARDESEASLELRVADNGVGMYAETLATLFDPFVQADVSTTRQYGGTGLGLSITNSLVDMMNGSIKVTSTPDEGTEFRVRLTLPVASEGMNTISPELPDLTGVRCVVWPDHHGEDWASYLEAAGASVSWPSGEIPTGNESGPRLYVVDTGGNEIGEFSGDEPPHEPSALWLFIERGRRRRVRRLDTNHYSIDADNLPQSGFLQAVEVVLGRGDTGPSDVGHALSEEGKDTPTFGKALPMAQILVAEDNAINRRVIDLQLAQFGYCADFCSDGEAAYKQWRAAQGQYDLIMSDLHMPGMDGYDLIRAIREEERHQESGRVPFIALTANALEGQESCCRDLGMDGYLVKPVSLEILKETLEQWLEPSSNDPEKTSSTSDSEEAGVLDLGVLLDLIGGDDELLEEFVESFRSTSGEAVREMRAAARRKDWLALSESAHSLKSSARSIGAERLAVECQKLEHWGRENTHGVEDGKVVLARFETEWHTLNQALDRADKLV